MSVGWLLQRRQNQERGPSCAARLPPRVVEVPGLPRRCMLFPCSPGLPAPEPICMHPCLASSSFFRVCCAAPCPHPRALHTQGRHHLNNAIFWPWGRLVALARRAQLDASGTPRRHVPEQTRNARRGALARLASARECSRVLASACQRGCTPPREASLHVLPSGFTWAQFPGYTSPGQSSRRRVRGACEAGLACRC